MEISAPTTLRERKMRETAARLTSACRRLTAERGLNGFTVEEVCEEVDISRRTFFNYFPTKEDAVIGLDPEEELQKFAADFLARGSHGWDRVIDDFADLVVEHFESAGINPADHAELVAAIEREPKLLTKFMGVSRARDKQAAELIAEREGVDLDDARVVACVNLVTLLIKSAGDRYFEPHNELDFSSLVHQNLSALRTVLGSSSPRKAHP